VAIAYSPDDQKKLGRLLSNIARDLGRLEQYLESVPSGHMDD
jgi:hypothetical protein